jgi:hypothetical protein
VDRGVETRALHTHDVYVEPGVQRSPNHRSANAPLGVPVYAPATATPIQALMVNADVHRRETGTGVWISLPVARGGLSRPTHRDLAMKALHISVPVAVEKARRDRPSSGAAQDGLPDALAIAAKPCPTGVAPGQKVGGDGHGREDAIYHDHRRGTRGLSADERGRDRHRPPLWKITSSHTPA